MTAHTNPVEDETLKELARSIMQSGYYDYRSDNYDQELEKNMQAIAAWHSQGVGEAEDLRPFDKTIADLEAVRLFLGLQLEECEQKISDTKKARLSRIKNLRSQTPQHTNTESNSTIAAPQLAEFRDEAD